MKTSVWLRIWRFLNLDVLRIFNPYYHMYLSANARCKKAELNASMYRFKMNQMIDDIRRFIAKRDGDHK